MKLRIIKRIRKSNIIKSKIIVENIGRREEKIRNKNRRDKKNIRIWIILDWK